MWRLLVALGVPAVVVILLLYVLWGLVAEWIKNYGEGVGALVAAIILLYALFYTRKQLQHMEKDRHSALLLNLVNIWESEEMHKARTEVGDIINKGVGVNVVETIDKAFGTDPKLYLMLTSVPNFFEDVGMLVGKKFLHPPELVLEQYSGPIIYLYEKVYGPYRENKKQSEPHSWEWFAYLYKLAKTYERVLETSTAPPETRPPAHKLSSELRKLFK